MQLRKTIAILGIAAVILMAATLVPSVAIAVCVIVTLLVPAIAVARHRTFVACDDQPVALLALVSFRAPPAPV